MPDGSTLATDLFGLFSSCTALGLLVWLLVLLGLIGFLVSLFKG